MSQFYNSIIRIYTRSNFFFFFDSLCWKKKIDKEKSNEMQEHDRGTKIIR